MAKTPDKLEAGMVFVGTSGAVYMVVTNPGIGKGELVPVYLEVTPQLSLHGGRMPIKKFVGEDTYIGKVDCKQLKLKLIKLKLKELINDEEE